MCTIVFVALIVSDCFIDLSCRSWKKQDWLSGAEWVAMVSWLSIQMPRLLTVSENCTVLFARVSLWTMSLLSWWRGSCLCLTSVDCWSSSRRCTQYIWSAIQSRQCGLTLQYWNKTCVIGVSLGGESAFGDVENLSVIQQEQDGAQDRPLRNTKQQH